MASMDGEGRGEEYEREETANIFSKFASIPTPTFVSRTNFDFLALPPYFARQIPFEAGPFLTKKAE